MAVEIGNFASALTGGLEEAAYITNNPTVDTGVTYNGMNSYLCAGNTSPPEVRILPFDGGKTDQGNKQIVGFAFRLNTNRPSTSWAFFQSRSNDIQLIMNTNGDVDVKNAGGASVVATITDPFINNTFHYIEILYDKLDTGADAKIFIGDIEKASITNDDFNGSGGSTTHYFRGDNAAGNDVWFSAIYMKSGAAEGDRIGSTIEQFMYQNTVGTWAGDALEVGAGSDMAELPLSETNEAGYTGDPKSGDWTTDEGTRGGPNGDAGIDGDSNIKVVKYMWRLKRGGGAGSTHKIRFGNSVDTITEETVSLGTSYANFFKISELATVMPLSTEELRQGFSVVGAQVITCAEMYAFILHVPLNMALIDEEGTSIVIN